MTKYDVSVMGLVVAFILTGLISVYAVLSITEDNHEIQPLLNCTPSYAIYENSTHYISQPLSGCMDSDFCFKATLKNKTSKEEPLIKEIKSVEVKAIIQDNTSELHYLNYTEDDCIGACELVNGFSNRSGFKSSSKRSTQNLAVRCGGVGERPCEVIRNDR